MNIEQFTIKIKDNMLFHRGIPWVICDDPIRQYLVLDEIIIILTDSSISKKTENIYCHNKEGELIWQIQPFRQTISGQNYYTSIYISGGNLMAYNFNGFEVTIEKENGKILKEELIK